MDAETYTIEEIEIFKYIQELLKNTPLIVWGSGATIPLGFPSMHDLNTILKNKISSFDENCTNLEKELSKEQYENYLPQIKTIIWEAIKIRDDQLLKNIVDNNLSCNVRSISKLIQFYLNSYPSILNIITTNYDRALEHIMSYFDIPFTDGFNGKNLSQFNVSYFNGKGKDKQVNLIKPHGSLNWFSINGSTRYYQTNDINTQPKIIIPGKNKFYESLVDSLYRDLIIQADQLINDADIFLIIGFGFNDEHLTPKIEDKIKNGTPIILITKEVTDQAQRILDLADKYVLISSVSNHQSNVVYKNNKHLRKLILNKEY